MAMYAPEVPSLSELEGAHPLAIETEAEIMTARTDVSDVLSGERDGLVVIEGPCAMTLARDIIDQEGEALYAAQQRESGLLTLHRMPPWKPRTNPGDWHGLESESETVVDAYRTVAERAAATANVAIEIGHIAHLDRYGRRITLGWSGSRNAEDGDLIEALALHDQSMPVGVKNGMDGTIDGALGHVARINELRDGHGAPAVLIYRGGTNAQAPEAWAENYRAALDATDGQMIVDTAHGGEMAFDPNGHYKKSIVGQIACLEKVIEIAEDYGETPAGIIMEASSAESPTDPVMPFRIALNGARRLHELRMSVSSTVR
jgi:phospho-2-dehydro-3-deoxyheptonate aldolase